MPTLATNPRRRLPLLALVLLAHAVVLGWLNANWHKEAAAPHVDEIELRLLTPVQPPSPRLASRHEASAHETRAPPVLPAALTLPGAPAALPKAPAVATLTQVPGPAASSPHLNLQLPRPFGAAEKMLEEVRADPRSHTPRPTLESRIADATGPADVQTTTYGNGDVKLHQGSGCVMVMHSRTEQIDPMDSRLRNAPRTVTTCK